MLFRCASPFTRLDQNRLLGGLTLSCRGPPLPRPAISFLFFCYSHTHNPAPHLPSKDCPPHSLVQTFRPPRPILSDHQLNLLSATDFKSGSRVAPWSPLPLQRQAPGPCPIASACGHSCQTVSVGRSQGCGGRRGLVTLVAPGHWAAVKGENGCRKKQDAEPRAGGMPVTVPPSPRRPTVLQDVW